ncbi:MAG: hypothetical protein H0V06_07565 [Gemmatimonadetes bacterium]|nr:hypothetical protein [Gemmatimonadota bacterium]
MLIIALIWGFAVVADSAQFSAVITEVAPSHAVGTALTLQTSLGFLLTIVTIQGVPLLREVAGWPVAFGVLALGPAAGIVAMLRLKLLRTSTTSPITEAPFVAKLVADFPYKVQSAPKQSTSG